MTNIAIRVENLSKLYRIGKAQERHDTIRDALTAGLRTPLERLRRNRGAGSGDQGAGNRESGIGRDHLGLERCLPSTIPRRDQERCK